MRSLILTIFVFVSPFFAVLAPALAADAAIDANTSVEKDLDAQQAALFKEIDIVGQQLPANAVNPPNATPTVESTPIAAKKESEIPVFKTVTAKKAAASQPWARMGISFGVLVVLALGGYSFSRWYSRRHRGEGDTNKIRVLTQHHLGPRKNLTIIRVAGETMLIGVTDHNINLIKSLSLIDDEIPEGVPQSFSSSMQNADRKTASTSVAVKTTMSGDEETDEFIIGNIKDKLTSKLKNLRPI